MRECLDEDSAAATLSLAAKFSCEGLQSYISSFIAANFHAMRPDGLGECTLSVFADLISRDDLSLHSELQVFTSACSPAPL